MIWFVFKLPGCTSFTPAESEAEGRRRLVAICYRGAPVGEWPCVGSLEASPGDVVRAWRAKLAECRETTDPRN